MEFAPSHVFSIGFSHIAFLITVLPKDDRTDSFQEEQLRLPHWTMILAICVVVDESKCLDIPIWKFSIILERTLGDADFGQTFGHPCFTEFGQADFIWCFSLSRRVGPEGWGPKFRVFPLSHTPFYFFLLSLGVFSWIFGVV